MSEQLFLIINLTGSCVSNWLQSAYLDFTECYNVY